MAHDPLGPICGPCEMWCASHSTAGPRRQNKNEVMPLSNFQNQKDVVVGAQFQADTSHGPRLATVTKVDGQNVTVDLNHPLADQTLPESPNSESLAIRIASSSPS